MSTAQPANFLITLLLGKYAEKKGLTVNTAKSEVVHFNSKSVSPLQSPFTYDGVRGASREGQVQIFGHAA